MNRRFLYLFVTVLGVTFIIGACTPKATPPPVNSMDTMVAKLAFGMMTQTAAAASPTPLPATATPIPSPTEAATATVQPAPGSSELIGIVKGQAGCWFGPGPTYQLESYITDTKKVKLLGVGSVPGWYIVLNPYFNKPCWIKASDISIDPAVNVSTLPVMTP